MGTETTYRVRDMHGNVRYHDVTLERAKERVAALDRFQSAYGPHSYEPSACTFEEWLAFAKMCEEERGPHATISPAQLKSIMDRAFPELADAEGEDR